MNENEKYLMDLEIEERQPELGLLAAMLDRVIRDALLTQRCISRETYAYINKKLVSNPKPFSFQYICEQLDIDPIFIKDYINNYALKNYRPRDKKEPL